MPGNATTPPKASNRKIAAGLAVCAAAGIASSGGGTLIASNATRERLIVIETKLDALREDVKAHEPRIHNAELALARIDEAVHPSNHVPSRSSP